MARVCAVLLLCWLVPVPAPACSLCTTPLTKNTLGQELDRASFIFFGYAANPRLNLQPGAPPGAGATDFHIEKIVKSDLKLGEPRTLTLERFVPVLDAKDPPHFLIFCTMLNGKLDPYLGRQTKSRAVIDYLERARAERARGKVAALQYYARFFDDADELVAEDAFLEFARSTDEEVGQAARKLDPARLRALLSNPALDVGRVSLFAFLLGCCGHQGDADFLRKRIDQARADSTGEVATRALDGLLGGYIALRPKEGWQLTRAIVADRKHGFLTKYSALRAVRFYMGWQAALTKAPMLATYELVVPDGEMADLAIEDLRRWKTWDLTKLILAQYRKPSHDAPIVKRCILRYALSCPLPEARRFIDGVRAQDPALVRELSEALDY